jgi:hypothetical protein
MVYLSELIVEKSIENLHTFSPDRFIGKLYCLFFFEFPAQTLG